MSHASDEPTPPVRQFAALPKSDASPKGTLYVENGSSLFRLEARVDALHQVLSQAVALLKKDASLGWAQYIDDESSSFRLRVRVDALQQAISVPGLFDASAEVIAAKIRGEPRKFLAWHSPHASEDIFWKVCAGLRPDDDILSKYVAWVDGQVPRSPRTEARTEPHYASYNSKNKGDAAMC